MLSVNENKKIWYKHKNIIYLNLFHIYSIYFKYNELFFLEKKVTKKMFCKKLYKEYYIMLIIFL